jgi:hypothetical protein
VNREECGRKLDGLLYGTITCLLIAVSAKPEDTIVARQWPWKHVSTATNSRDCGNDFVRNSRGIAGSVIFCWVRRSPRESGSEVVVRPSPPSGGVRALSEVSPLSKAVAYQRLEKT